MFPPYMKKAPLKVTSNALWEKIGPPKSEKRMEIKTWGNWELPTIEDWCG